MKLVTAISDGVYNGKYIEKGMKFSVGDDERSAWFHAAGEEPLTLNTMPNFGESAQKNDHQVANLKETVTKKDKEIAELSEKLAEMEAMMEEATADTEKEKTDEGPTE